MADRLEILNALNLCEETRFNKEDLKKIHPNATFIEDKNTDTQGFMLVKRGEFIVVFRGSQQAPDWLNDFDAWQHVIPYGNYESAIRVHQGFLRCYKSVRGQILSYIQKHKSQISKITVAGHSLGGAIAILCAVDIQYNFSDIPIRCYPSGNPMVGNKAFCVSYNKRVPNTTRTYMRKDVVPHLPPKFWSILFKGGYHHVEQGNPIGPKCFWVGLLNFFKIKHDFAANITNHLIALYKQWC